MIRYMEVEDSQVTEAVVSLVKIEGEYACNFAINFSENFNVETLEAIAESLGTFRNKIERLIEQNDA